MRVLYIGAESGTSLQRANALRRLGHEVTQIDPYKPLPRRWASWLKWLGGPGIDFLVAYYISRQIPGDDYKLAHVDSGDVVGPRSLAVIRANASIVTNYNADNPYVDPPVTRRRWRIFRRAVGGYDFTFAPRRPGILNDMLRRGAHNPKVVMFCADELLHAPPSKIADEWQADVCFVGTWMPGRDKFMVTLLEAGVELALYGPRWDRAPLFDKLKTHWRRSYLDGADYAFAIAGAKIALVILNGENHDLHTTRSVEIPTIGTAMVAQRTADHEEMYLDGTEAVFFSDATECAEKCLKLLSDPKALVAMAAAGHARALKNGNFNEPLMDMILREAIGKT